MFRTQHGCFLYGIKPLDALVGVTSYARNSFFVCLHVKTKLTTWYNAEVKLSYIYIWAINPAFCDQKLRFVKCSPLRSKTSLEVAPSCWVA